jgi:hypothetical protein
VGLVVLFRQKRLAILAGFLSITAAFGFFMVKAGDVFSTHGYYMVPFAPPMAVVAALALTRLPMKWSMVALGVICAEGVANQNYDMFVPDKRKFMMALKRWRTGSRTARTSSSSTPGRIRSPCISCTAKDGRS